MIYIKSLELGVADGASHFAHIFCDAWTLEAFDNYGLSVSDILCILVFVARAHI